jgi:hypothetical protein
MAPVGRVTPMAAVVGAAMRIKMAAQDEDDRRDAEQAEAFEHLYNRVKDLLKRFGRPNFLSDQRYGDYSVHGDYATCPRLVVFITSLKMLMPSVVHALQQLLTEFPGWQIDLRVAVWEHLKDWPKMSLSILPNEITDDLQRQYFPKEFQGLKYESGSNNSGAE